MIFSLLQTHCCYNNLIRNKKVKPKGHEFGPFFYQKGLGQGPMAAISQDARQPGRSCSRIQASTAQDIISSFFGTWIVRGITVEEWVGLNKWGVRDYREVRDDLGTSVLRQGAEWEPFQLLGIASKPGGGCCSVHITASFSEPWVGAAHVLTLFQEAGGGKKAKEHIWGSLHVWDSDSLLRDVLVFLWPAPPGE